MAAVKRDIERREFLRRSAWVAASPLVLTANDWAFPEATDAKPRVVHVHHAMAARCPSKAGNAYRDFVDQARVTQMLDQAVQTLKGGSLSEAWGRVFSLPAPETRRLAIKVNCNNATDRVNGAGNIIDAIPEPAIATIRGFVLAGGHSANCSVFDATTSAPQRYIATWFRQKVLAVYPDVNFDGFADSGGSSDAFDPRTHVTWDSAYRTPPGETRMSNIVLNADYLVNIPIVKRHNQANVTLSYKNHLGSISGPDKLHPYLYRDVTEASVLADIMGSPVVPGDPSVRSFRDKTVLTVGDMLFGQPCTNFGHPPHPWTLYGGEWPNCLFVADDPVAADSVMADVLQGEPTGGGGCGAIASWARRYLRIAEQKGQGVHEHVTLSTANERFNPDWMTYSRIDYRYLDLWPSGADLRCTRLENGAILLQWEHYFSGLCEVWRASRPDFSDAAVLGGASTGRYLDNNPPEKAFYQVLYAG